MSDRVDTAAALLTPSEDVSFMLEVKPGAFILIGNGVDEDGSFAALHTLGSDFDDEILSLGAAYRVGSVQQKLPVDGR